MPTNIANNPRIFTITGIPPKTTWMKTYSTTADTNAPNAINME